MTPSLDALHDIHLPSPLSFWPPAPGWWILFLFVILILILTALRIFQHLKKTRPKRIALKTLSKLQHQYQLGREQETLMALSTLIRRAALAYHPRHKIANLEGDAWLAFLDQTGQTYAFTQGPGSILALGPYQQKAALNMDSLFDLIEKWLKALS